MCVYDIENYILLHRYSLTESTLYDGVLDQLNSKKVTEAGPLDMLNDTDSENENGFENNYRDVSYQKVTPGLVAQEEMPGSLAKRKVKMKLRALALSPIGILYFLIPIKDPL